MKYIFAAATLSLSLAFAAPAMAKSSQKFESSLTSTASTPVNIEVVIGDDLAYRANNLPKNIRDRGYGVRGARAGFSGNGYYGERDLTRLAQRLEKKVAQRLSKQGVAIDENAGTTLRLVITDARPNRPTFEQLSHQPSLSYRSFSNGGAAFEGQLISRSGEPLGDVSYAWYERNIESAAYSSTWTDANRAIDRFARKTAKTIGE